MARQFDKNIFIMLIAIMIGVVLITYFIADIVNQSKLETISKQHEDELVEIEDMNLKFTNNFLESSVLLDSAREDRAAGNYYFDIASLFFNIALSEKNLTLAISFANKTIQNCSEAMPNFLISYFNFQNSTIFFNKTKTFTLYNTYLTLLDLYVNLTKSGAKIALLRYNASKYLKYLAENITITDGMLMVENSSYLMDLLNQTNSAYSEELSAYEELERKISEYDIEGFTTIREPI